MGTRPVRLALIGNDASYMVNFRGPLIAALAARCIEVHALAPRLLPEQVEALRKLGADAVAYDLNPTGISPLEDFAAAAQLYAALRAIRPDKVLSFTVKPVVFGTLAAALARVPGRYALIEGLGRAFVDEPGRRRWLLKRTVSALYGLALGRATRTLFLNEDDRRDLIARGLVGAAASEVVGAIGVDLDEWRPSPPVVAPVTFLFAGRLLREKGVLDFIEAARRVRRQDSGVAFVVLGDTDKRRGSLPDAPILAAVDEGLIEWPGHVPPRPHFAAASVFVLPSYYREGVPRSIQEAMAMARPVITTDTPGCRDTVIAGETGLLVPPRDPAALADAMRVFIRDPQLIATMGARARRFAEERFDVEAANARLMTAMGL